MQKVAAAAHTTVKMGSQPSQVLDLKSVLTDLITIVMDKPMKLAVKIDGYVLEMDAKVPSCTKTNSKKIF